MAATDAHSHHSTLRERIVEHIFIGDALRSYWRQGVRNVEVLRSEFDAYGYDIVMVRGRTIRHIQFKTGRNAPGKVSIARALADKPSGCVIWIMVDDALNLGPFYYFGGAPGSPLPAISEFPSPRRATHNKEGIRPLRQNHCEVPVAQFRQVATIEEVLSLLFGPLEASAVQ
ncbi:MAG: hypothetical protein EPO08_06650 [Rhodospirillaceae bacterium]|nr:MAG: hypothetical protein EPO08_06650 [Rhodospirillaceae bacterium]